MSIELLRVELAFDAATDAGKLCEAKIELDEDFSYSRMSVSDYSDEVKVNFFEGESADFKQSVELSHFRAGANGAYQFKNEKKFKARTVYWVKGQFSGTGTKKVSLVFHP